MGCHLRYHRYEISQCYLPPNTSEHSPQKFLHNNKITLVNIWTIYIIFICKSSARLIVTVAHIFIDDGMEKKAGNETVCNRFVKQLVDVIELAATLVLCYLLKSVVWIIRIDYTATRTAITQLNREYLYMFIKSIFTAQLVTWSVVIAIVSCLGSCRSQM